MAGKLAIVLVGPQGAANIGAAARAMMNFGLSDLRLVDPVPHLTDEAFHEAIRLIEKHRAHLDRLAESLLEHETLNKEQLDALLADIEPESRAAETVGTVRVVR